MSFVRAKFHYVVLLLLLGTSPSALAQLAEGTATSSQVNSSPGAVGSGARALGMGSAFIAIADDATAASWNPAGLTQLERPEFSLVYSYLNNSEVFSSTSRRGLNFENDLRFDEINYGSFVYPIPWTFGGRNFVVSLSVLKQYNFDRDLDFRFNDVGTAVGGVVFLTGDYEFQSRGGLSSITPALGLEITDKLSLGAALNLYDQDLLPDNQWKSRDDIRQSIRLNNIGPAGGFDVFLTSKTAIEHEYDQFDGMNFTVGLLYKPNERWSIGAVYHSKWTADVRFRERVRINQAGSVFLIRDEQKQQITFPSALGIGVAYRFPNDRLTLSLDIARRDWDQFEVLAPENPNRNARRTSGVTGLNKNLSEIDPTYAVRLGAEYVFVDDIRPEQHYLPSLRAGIFYDPEPSGGRRNQFLGVGVLGRELKGNGDPVDFWGFSLGAGVLVKDRVNFDLAYIYRRGNGARTDTFGLYGTDADVEQHGLYASTVVYF